MSQLPTWMVSPQCRGWRDSLHPIVPATGGWGAWGPPNPKHHPPPAQPDSRGPAASAATRWRRRTAFSRHGLSRVGPRALGCPGPGWGVQIGVWDWDTPGSQRAGCRQPRVAPASCGVCPTAGGRWREQRQSLRLGRSAERPPLGRGAMGWGAAGVMGPSAVPSQGASVPPLFKGLSFLTRMVRGAGTFIP